MSIHAAGFAIAVSASEASYLHLCRGGRKVFEDGK